VLLFLFRAVGWASVVATRWFHSYLVMRARIQGFRVKSITSLHIVVQPAFSGWDIRAAKLRFGMIVMLVSLAATLEVAQRWIPGRHPQFIDFAASVAGTCLGMLAAMVVHRIALADLR